jgi:hypothetical protein
VAVLEPAGVARLRDWVAPTTIDEVLARLDEIIARSRQRDSRLGYFPALYRKVTEAVKHRITEDFFDDAARMERLDVLFAQRYLRALHERGSGGRPTEAWRITFDTARHWWPIVLQHLLLGINAHINLDLGIAAAQVAPGARIHDLRADFDRINSILAGLVDEVSDELSQVWPLLRILDRVGGRTDEAIINFSMERARAFAWENALRLAPLSESERAGEIRELDAKVADLAGLVLEPGPLITLATRIVRLGELRSVPKIIDILRSTPARRPIQI